MGRSSSLFHGTTYILTIDLGSGSVIVIIVAIAGIIGSFYYSILPRVIPILRPSVDNRFINVDKSNVNYPNFFFLIVFNKVSLLSVS